MLNNITKKIKKEYKKILISSAIMLFLSVYLALMFRLFFLGGGMIFNPITLLGDIKIHGFPIKSTLFVFLTISIALIYLIWKNDLESLDEDERNFKYSKSGVYGTASLLQESEIEGYAKIEDYKAAQGTILGQIGEDGKRIINTDMESRTNRHVAIFGASGSGKSRCYARPFIIQAVKRRESVIVTDPKGELYESTAQYMKDNGYIVRILDLVHPDKSDGWDCLKELQGDELRAQIFSNVVIQNTGSGKGDIWDNSAMSLFKALLLRVERGHDYRNSGKQNIGEAYELIQNPMGEKYLDAMFDTTNLSREEQLCIGPYMTFKQGSDNMRGNIITGLATRLQVFQNEVIRKLTSVDDIDLTLPATEPCAYYCIMSDQHTTLNFLSTLFFSFLFIDLVEYADSNGGKCPVPVNFLLDEFPNIGSIPDFEKKISTVRSRMINISIIFQSVTQLQERYPLGKWQVILGNCDTHLFLGCNEPETAKFISDRSGETTVKVKTEQHEKIESMFNVGHKHSTGDGKRRIYTVDEIQTFPLNEELIIFRGKNVMKANKYDWSLHPEYEKFKAIQIKDRPSINDTRGRLEYKRRDENCIKEYYNKVRHDEEPNVAENKSRKNILDKFSHRKQDTVKEDSMRKINENGDIELKQDDYFEYDGDIVETEDIQFEDIFDNPESDVESNKDDLFTYASDETKDTNEYQRTDETRENINCRQPVLPNDNDIERNFVKNPINGDNQSIKVKRVRQY